jgi:hypothetical protein
MRGFKVIRGSTLGLAAGTAALWCAHGARAQTAPGAPPPKSDSSIIDAIRESKLTIDLRPRYEGVDQAGFTKDAEAFTLRTQLGLETGAWNDLRIQLGFQNVSSLGPQRYNSTINGQTQYPVVADPPTTELHVADLVWTPDSHFTATVGRQRINLDDQRFIGTVNWRQDEQSFDAARIDAQMGNLSLTYVYLEHINRVFSDVLDWDSDSHALNVYYTLAKPLKLEGFYYAFAFANSPANSSLTYGGKVSGQLSLSPVELVYAGTYARQQSYRNDPARFGLDYWHGELSGTVAAFTLKGEYEILGGNGLRGFGTPLASLHAFEGSADVFLTTPAKGVRNANLSLDIKPPLELPLLSRPDLFIRYDDFTAATDGSSLGHEWDFQATAQIAPHLTGLVGVADFRGEPPGPASRTKVYASLEFKL